VSSRVQLESGLGSDRLVDFLFGHFPFLRQTVRHHYGFSSMKKLQHPVVNSLVARP
jgi:hypothetical protein